MSDAVHAPIHDLIAAYESSLNAGDAEAIAALFAPDGGFYMDTLPSVAGRDEVRAAYAQVFAGVTIGSTFRVHDVVVSGDTAWATTTSTGWIEFRERGETAPRSTRAMFVFARVDGDWRIARYMYNKFAVAAAA